MFEKIIAFFSKLFLFTGKVGQTKLFSFEKKLSPEKEKEYFARLKLAKINGTSDPEAEEMLTKHNLRLVAHISKKYKSSFSDPDDLISIGSIGLIKAVRTFDPDKAKQFSSYASRCIENEILMILRHEKKMQGEISMETSLGADAEGNELTIADTLCDERTDLENLITTKATYKKVLKIINEQLSPREKEIIIRRYGLNGKTPETQRKVASSLNISRSYISRIETSAIEKIKKFAQHN